MMLLRGLQESLLCQLTLLVVLDGCRFVQLKIPAVQTERFAWTTAVYDLELVFLDETVVRIVEGVVSVSAGVTR